MKKIVSILLMTAILLSAFIPAMSVSAEDGNPTEFIADFTTTDNWTGLTTSIHTTDGWFGCGRDGYGNSDIWTGPTGTITTVQSYDFGEEFTAQFQLLSGFANGDTIRILEDYTVTIGKFKIAICDFQTRIVLYYDGQEVKGTNTAKGDTAYDRNYPTRDYTYDVKISKGDIVIESNLLVYTSNFKTYEAVNNAQISLTINETWQIGNSFFKSFSASAYVPNETSFTADFSSTDGFEGLTSEINTDEKWFGATSGFNGYGSWVNPMGTITTTDKFDFGSVFDASVSLYTFYRNHDENGANEDYYINIGNFKIAVCDFQTRIKVYYNNVAIDGVCTAKGDIAYPAGGKRDYTYDIHIEAGNIVIESNLIKYTSDFADFDAVNDAAVALTINENWQIATGYFTTLTIAADSRTADTGDVNADGAINANDLVAVKRWLLNIDNALVWRFGDINADSNRNILDFIRLKKLLSMVNNATTFTADFTTTDSWLGDVEDLGAINTAEGWYGSKPNFNGCTNGWNNPKTTIATAAKYNFGTALAADFALYTRYSNNATNVVTDSFDVKIGNFTIRVSAYQNQITLLYGTEKIASVWNEVYDYSNDTKYYYNYSVYISKGAIQIIQYTDTARTNPLLVLDSNFDDFGAIDNVNISLTVNEDWEIAEAHFGSLSISAIADNAEEFTADFSSAEYWTGTRTDLINTVPMWFGTQTGGFGNTGDKVWNSPTGYITANEKIDLGYVFDAEFTLYTSGWHSNNDDRATYAVNIGDFRIVVRKYQESIQVFYKGQELGGVFTDKVGLTATNVEKDYTYKVHVEPGKISVTVDATTIKTENSTKVVTTYEDAMTYTSDFSDYDAIINAEIKLENLEDWVIKSGRITDFSVSSVDGSYNSVAVKSLIDGGTVTIDKSIAKAGETVTVTVSPADGYMLAAGGLYYEKNDGTKVIISDSDDGVTFTFEMPDSDISIAATFTETAETELSVSAVSFYPNNENVAHSDGILVDSVLSVADENADTYIKEGESFAIQTYGVSVTDSDGNSRFITSDNITNNGKLIKYTTLIDSVDDWTENYTVTPCVKLVSTTQYNADLLGSPKTVSLNSAAGLTSDVFALASYVNINDTKNYIVHNGKPYINNGVQAQINRRLLSNQPDNPVEFNTSIKPIFEKAAELNYNTLVYMLPWRFFEAEYDIYNYDIIKMLFDCANQYDLDIQLIWGGTDVCGGHSVWVPNYIKNNSSVYPFFGTSQKLDYSDKDLIYREKKAFSELLKALYINDTERRTVAIQIENEPNAGLDGVPSFDTDDSVKETWVGQEKAVKSLINQLAVLCDTGAYRCVTRVNYVAYNCYFNGMDNDDPVEFLNNSAIDIVGFSAYGSLNFDEEIFNTITNENNVPHLAESNGGTMLAPAKMLYATTKGGGFLQYELEYVNGYSGEYCVLNSDGSYRDGSEGGNITTELISVNKMLAALAEKMAVLPYENMAVLNLEQSLECTENVSVCGLEISYSHTTDDPYGGAGMILCDTDSTYYLYHSRGDAVFDMSGKTVTGLSIGTFENGVWVEKRAVDTAQSIKITAEDALNGYLCRVMVN